MCPGEDHGPVAESSSPSTPPQQLPPSTTQRNSSTTWSTIVATFGLPCIIGVAAIDPGNLEVDLQAGATLGYNLIWALLLSSILGCILQTLAAHVTICTGLHLAELCQRVYHRDWLMSRAVFLMTMLSIIAFDVAEVIGTAFAIQMIFGVPLWLGMLLSACDTMLVLYLQRTGLSRIELIVEGLLFILAACVVYEFILSKPSISAMAKGAFIPSFGDADISAKGIVLAVSIMGSVIMSHNLFLHSWLEKERQRLVEFSIPSATRTEMHVGRATVVNFKRACRYAGIESSAIFFSTFLINSCILVVAATLPRSLVEGGDLGLKQAGALLQHVLGQRLASTAWSIALLASGHAATVTGALASQAVCEGFLNIHDGQSSSLVIMGSRMIAIVPAVAAALVAGEKGSDGLAVASQTVLSFALPFAAIPLFKVLDVVATMRPNYGRGLLNTGYVVFCVVMVANAYALWQVGQTILMHNGLVALSVFVLMVSAVSALLFKLVLTPVHRSDFAALVDVSEVPSEHEQLIPDKQNACDR